jgi:MFS family permease
MEAIGHIRPSTRLAIISTLVFALAIGVFALSRSYLLSVIMLVIAGVSTIASSSISQTVVQLDAPQARRGRFLGAFGMTSMGLRVGSGVLFGVLGAAIGVPAAVAIDAGILALIAVVLLIVVAAYVRRRPSGS